MVGQLATLTRREAAERSREARRERAREDPAPQSVTASLPRYLQNSLAPETIAGRAIESETVHAAMSEPHDGERDDRGSPEPAPAEPAAATPASPDTANTPAGEVQDTEVAETRTPALVEGAGPATGDEEAGDGTESSEATTEEGDDSGEQTSEEDASEEDSAGSAEGEAQGPDETGGGGGETTVRLQRHPVSPDAAASASDGRPIARKPRIVPYRVEQSTPRFGKVEAPLRMPAYLTAKPKQDAGSLPPELADYAGYFAKAATAARQVYGEILQAAARERSQALATARRLADRRSLLLDRSMRELGADFQLAVAELREAEFAAAAELRGLAREARREIRAAARRARGTINGRHASLTASLSGLQTRREEAVGLIDNHQACITWGATYAHPKMGQLERQPRPTFTTSADTEGKDMLSLFTNEILGKFIPQVAAPRKTFWQEEGAKQVTRVTGTHSSVVNTLNNGFREFDQLLKTLGPISQEDPSQGAALKQIGKMERKAIGGCNDTERKIRAAIRKVRVEGENSLVEQFENARAAVADNIQQVAEREITAEEKGTNALVMRYDGLAFAQGVAIASLADTIAGRTDLPPEDFARFVIESTTNARNEAQGKTREQLGIMVRSSRKTEDSMIAQAAGSRDAIEKSTGASGAVMGKAARQIATTLSEQVAATRHTFRKMPEPVTKTLDNYPIPGGRDLEQRLEALSLKVDDAFEIASAAWEGREAQLQSPQEESAGGGENGQGEAAESPAMTPKDFVEKSYVVAETPQEDDTVKTKRDEGIGAARTDANDRGGRMNGQMTLTGQSPEATMDIVRGITNLQGWALREAYSAIPRGNLWDDIPYYVSFGNLVTDPFVRVYYGRAIQNYLQGNHALGARYELQGATWGWDDTEQADKAMEGLDAASREELLHDLPDPDGIMASIREDLDGVDGQVFAAFERGDAQGARALRLEQAVEKARATRGDAGADAAYDAMTRYYDAMGSTRMESNDPYNLAGTTLYPGDPPTPEQMEATRTQQWNELMRRYGNEGQVREEGAEGIAAGQQALITDATEQRLYYDHTAGEDYRGHYRHDGRIVREGISEDQQRLMNAAARHGPRSPQARAAQIMVEEGRPGEPKRERVENALDFNGINEDLSNPDTRIVGPEQARPEGQPMSQNELARQQQEAMLRAYAEFRGEQGEDGAEPSTQDIRQSMGRRLAAAAGDDRNLANLMQARATEDPHSPRVAALAIRDAVERGGTLEEEIKRQFRRMSRDQIEAAAALYKSEFGEDMFARLGIFEHSDNTWTELSGDDANEIQALAMGVPRNDRERFEVARMRSKIEIDDSTSLGRWLASDEAARMQATYDRLNMLGGGSELKFDERGYIVNHETGQAVGNFDASGNFAPPDGAKFDRHSLGIAITAARQSTDQYKAATDAIANIITTSLVITAAAVSTFFTGGGAAAIWVPVLTTMAAGMAGMAVNYAIKGGRYGYEDMARDFAMTIIQSATAGAGAAMGVYLAGGKTALQAVAGRMMVADEALGAFLAAGGKSMRALTFADEIAIGAATGVMGGVGNAVMDEKAWDKGEWGTEFGHHLIKGAMSGVIGAGAGRAMGSGSQRAGLQFTGRTLGSGTGAFMGSVAEAAYDEGRGKSRGPWGKVLGQAAMAGLQATAQGVLEYGAEKSGDRRAAARPDGFTARARRRMMDTQVNLPGGGAAAHVPGMRRPGTLGPDAVSPENLAAIRRDPALSDALDAVLLADQFGIPIGPDMLPEAIRPIARALADMPDSAPDQPRQPSAANDDADAPAARMRSRDDPDADADIDSSERITRELPAVVVPPPARPELGDAGPLRLLDFLDAGRPTDQLVFANADLDREMLRGRLSVPDDATIFASDPYTEGPALANYEALRGADLHREVLLAHNPQTGEYKVIQGIRGSVRAPGEGWATLRHSHPRQHEGAILSDRLSASLPSAFGGDFTVLRGELNSGVGVVDTPQGRVRCSVIDIQLGEQRYETHFSITRIGQVEEYRVRFVPPHDGVDEFGPFTSIAHFEREAVALVGRELPQAETRNGSVMMSRDGGMGAVVSRRPATHGETLDQAGLSDVGFIRQRMAQADDFEAQVQGLRPQGDIDPVLGRAASLIDAQDRVRRMGLVGEEDSMIRLHTILNDERIPEATRALISDVTLEATRQHMLDTGELQPGEPLIMLFHGATRSRSDSLVEQGIDFRRNPGGVNDDFGEGLYFTRHFESAQVYRKGRQGDTPGDVIPYILRGSDLGSVVDVSTGGAHRRQWEEFVMNNLHLFTQAEGYLPLELADAMINGTLAFDELPFTTNRGEVFNAFLASLGDDHGHPQIIFGDLGGPLTSGIQYRGGVTDQAAVRSQRLGDIMNAQHIRRRSDSGDVTAGGPGLRMRSRIDPDEVAAMSRTHPDIQDINALQRSLAVPDPQGPHALIDRIRSGAPDADEARAALDRLYDTPDNADVIEITQDDLRAKFPAFENKYQEARVEIHGMEFRLYRAKPTTDVPDPEIRFEASMPPRRKGERPKVYQFGDGELRVWRSAPTKEHPQGRLIQRSVVTEGQGRKGYEDHLFSHSEGEYAGPTLERGHLHGGGLGFESTFGIGLVPREVNQILQNRGVEGWMRRLRDALPEGATLMYSTDVTWHKDTRRHARIDYGVDIVINGKRHRFAEFAINIDSDPPGTKQADRQGTRRIHVDPVTISEGGGGDRSVQAYFASIKEIVDMPQVLVHGLPRTGPSHETVRNLLAEADPAVVQRLADSQPPWGLKTHNPAESADFDPVVWSTGLRDIMEASIKPRFLVVDLRNRSLTWAQKHAIHAAVRALPESRRRRIMLLDVNEIHPQMLIMMTMLATWATDDTGT